MPTIESMNQDVQIYDPMQPARDTTITQNKLTNLTAKKEEKLASLNDTGWKSALLEKYTDADSPQIIGVTGGKGKGGDLTGKYTEDRYEGFDAYEVAHPGDPYRNTPSGIAKYERQRQRLANDIKTDPSLIEKLSIKDVNSITDEDIAKAGTREQLLGLYDLIPGKKEAWEPGPLDYYGTTPLELGSKKDPLNIPVERKDSGEFGYFGRPLAQVRNVDTKQTTMDTLNYDGKEDLGYSAAIAIEKLKAEGTLTPELESYINKNARYVTNPQAGTSAQKGYSKEALDRIFGDGATNGRTWEEAAKDTGLQLVAGSEMAVKNLADIYGVATGDMDNFVSKTMQGAADWHKGMYSQSLKDATVKKEEAIKQGNTELDKFVITAKENIDNPMLIAQLVTESVPMMVTALAVGEAAAPLLGISAATGMVGAGAVQQGIDMGSEVYNSFKKVPDEYWVKNEKYNELIDSGLDSISAKKQIAIDTARVVATASGLLSYGVNRYMPGGKAIEDALTGVKGKTAGVLKSVAGESVTEGIEEGGGKAFQNVGLQQVKDDVKIEEGTGTVVADAMSAGGATAAAVKSPGFIPGVLQGAGEVLDYGKKSIEKATESPSQKIIRENMEYTAPLKAEAVTAMTSGQTDEVVTRVEAIHGKVSADLDESAPKSFTYGIVIRDALNKAIKAEDNDAIRNVYKAIGELDSREDVDFKASSVIEDRTFKATQEFIKLINSNPETAEDKLEAMKLGKQVTDEAAGTVSTDGAKMVPSILAKVKAMKESIEKDRQDMKDVMGSEAFDELSKHPDKLIEMMEKYLKGKDVNDVNAEMAELGFIQFDPTGTGLKVDPNRPGVSAYAKELKEQLLNPKANKNLLDKKAEYVGGATIRGLQRFALSRLEKLTAMKQDTVYQTGNFIDAMMPENEKMLGVIEELLATAEGLIDIAADKKAAYVDALQEAMGNAIAANKALIRRNAILKKLGKAKNGQYAFQVDRSGNESILVVNGANKVEVAKVDAEGNVEWLGEKPTSTVDSVNETTSKAMPEEVVSGEDYYSKAKFKEGIEPEVTESTKENVVIEPTMESVPDEVVNKEDFKAQAKFEEPVVVTKPEPVDPKDPLRAVREKAKKLDEALAAELDSVGDMQVKSHVKEYYTKKLKELQADRGILEKLFNRIEKAIDARMERIGSVNTKNPLAGLLAYADKLIKSMLNKLDGLRTKLRLNSKQQQATKKAMNELLDMINGIEESYMEEVGVKPGVVKHSFGKVTKYEDTVYGTPMIEVDGERTAAPQRVTKNGKQTPKVAMDQAIIALKESRLAKVEAEIKETGSLGARIVKRLLNNFNMSTAVHRIVERGNDSIFGKMGADMFDKPNELLKELPKTFKDFFVGDDEVAGKELVENIKTMGRFIKGTTIGDIHVGGKNAPIRGNVDQYGFIMKSAQTYMPVDREIKIGDRIMLKSDHDTLKDAPYNAAAYKAAVIEVSKNTKIPSKEELKNYLVNETQETSIPVDMVELIGTVNEKGVLEIDPQTETILKFYSAKLMSDTQAMVGKILSMDNSEMGKALGVYDTTEQEIIRANAMEGYVASSSVRKDVGSEVYQALGIRLGKNTPEFTEEAFKSALGVLVQAIAVDNGTVNMKKYKDTKGEDSKPDTEESTTRDNQNLITVNQDKIEEILGETGNHDMIKAMNKLQYLSENRSRPLPSLKKLDKVKHGDRFVMNTKIPVNEEANDLMNRTEEIGYKISNRLAEYLEMDEKDVLKAMGYVDLGTISMHASKVSAQQARNDKLVREWDILKVFARSVKDNTFYIPWGQTVSERYTMLSDLQYQESKLHREFVVAEGSTKTVDPKDKDNKQMLMASILQGLDMDPDKLSPETAEAKFKEAFKVTSKGITVLKDGPVKRAYEARLKGEFDVDAMAEVFDDSEGHHGISSIELLVAWNNALRDGKSLDTHANLEIDAITSGMILTLLQIGTKKAVEMAEKGGIYTADRLPELKKYVEKWLPGATFTPGALIEAGKKHAAEIEAKMETAVGTELIALRKELEDDAVFKDLYSTIGVAMIGEVQAYEKTLNDTPVDKRSASQVMELAMLKEIGTLNLKNIRSIAKSPVMVYIYGASIGSIKNKLTFSLGVDTVVKAIESASKLEAKKAELNSDIEAYRSRGKLTKKETEELGKLVDELDANEAKLDDKKGFIDLFIPNKSYRDAYGIPVPKTTVGDVKGLDTMTEAEKLLYLDVSEGIIETIGKVINATFGTAIETAFTSRLGFVDDNRDAVKSVEMLTFEAYNIKLAAEIKKELDERYGDKHNGESHRLSKDDLVRINSRLTEQGYGHTILWSEDGKKDRNQSLQKTGTKGSMHSSRVRVGDGPAMGGQIKEGKATVNTGAASTIPIHAIDGYMMLQTLNRELSGELTGQYTGGNVYDAVVLSIDKAMLTDTADYYNTGMIETGFSRSIMADQLTKLEKMLTGLTEEERVTLVASIGLRPEGKGRMDYSKEAMRLGISVSKMLQRIEQAETLNAERVANSKKAYGSGHLYQMGSGVVDVAASEKARAKEFPEISAIKTLLKERIELDRKQTAEEFGDKIGEGVDYVLDLNDFVAGKNITKSKANLAQFRLETDREGKVKFKMGDKLWTSLNELDTVQVIGDIDVIKEKLDSKDHGKSAEYQLGVVMTELEKSKANIVGKKAAAKKDSKGKDAVKQNNDTIPANTKATELAEMARECAK